MSYQPGSEIYPLKSKVTLLNHLGNEGLRIRQEEIHLVLVTAELIIVTKSRVLTKCLNKQRLYTSSCYDFRHLLTTFCIGMNIITDSIIVWLRGGGWLWTCGVWRDTNCVQSQVSSTNGMPGIIYHKLAPNIVIIVSPGQPRQHISGSEARYNAEQTTNIQGLLVSKTSQIYDKMWTNE